MKSFIEASDTWLCFNVLCFNVFGSLLLNVNVFLKIAEMFEEVYAF